MSVSLIAAFDDHRAIGKDNRLLWHLPDDLRYFKRLTLDKPIVMGRKTFDSIGRPLPKRRNIVVTRQLALSLEGCECVTSLEQAVSLAGDALEVMVIGGASLYQQALPLADKLYITRVHHKFDADVFFPTIDEQDWTLESREAHPRDERHDYDFEFLVYQRRVPDSV